MFPKRRASQGPTVLRNLTQNLPASEEGIPNLIIQSNLAVNNKTAERQQQQPCEKMDQYRRVAAGVTKDWFQSIT